MIGRVSTQNKQFLFAECVKMYAFFGRTEWTQNLRLEDQNRFQGPGAYATPATYLRIYYMYNINTFIIYNHCMYTRCQLYAWYQTRVKLITAAHIWKTQTKPFIECADQFGHWSWTWILDKRWSTCELHQRILGKCISWWWLGLWASGPLVHIGPPLLILLINH